MTLFPDSFTKLTGLFGYPVSHSLSPQIHNAAFRTCGMNWLYLAFEVGAEDLEAAFKGCRVLGLTGLNITIPHKQAVGAFLDDLSREARLIGAVNTVRFKDGKAIGHNTDGRGFVAALKEERGFSLKGKKVCVIGAGGAGRAVAVQSALEGASRIFIFDLLSDRAEALVRLINGQIADGLAVRLELDRPEWKGALSGADLVVEATSLGLQSDDPLSFDPGLLSPSVLVMDLVYNPAETPLLKKIRESGRDGINGLEMLVQQAVLSWELWTGQEAPGEVMKATAREVLYQ